MVITSIIVAVILFVLYSNRDKIKAWLEPDPARDKDPASDKDKDDKPPVGNNTTLPNNAPIDYNKVLEYKSTPIEGKEVKILQKILNKEIEYLKTQPNPLNPNGQSMVLAANQLITTGLPNDAKLTVDGVFGTKTQDYLKKIAGVEKTSLSLLANNPKIKATNATSLYTITP